MRIRAAIIIATIVAVAVTGCGDEPGTTHPTEPVSPAPAVLLKDVVIPRLPSPYFHFDYDASGRLTEHPMRRSS